MAVGHAVRRGLAEAVLRRWRRVVDPADIHAAAPDPLPPPLPVVDPAAAPLLLAPAAIPHADIAAALFGGVPLPMP